MKKMARILCAILTLALAFSLMAMSAAADPDPKVASFTVDLTVTGDKNPTVTFAYTIAGPECISEPDGTTTTGYVTGSAPTIGEAAFAAETAQKTVNVDFSDTVFNVPGAYRYTITATDPAVAGVELGDTTIYLDVYVSQSDCEGHGLEYTYVFHTDSEAEAFAELAGGKKITGITNTYASYDLTVSKAVTGNQGDLSKYFKFTVKADLPAGASYPYGETAYTVDITGAEANPTASASTIYSEMTNPATVTATELAAGVDFYLKNGQSIVIKGLPKGSTYEVTEVNEGYTQSVEGTAVLTNDGTETHGLTANATVAFTNNKTGSIPTGVVLGTVSGIALLAGGAFGIVAIKRRKNGED
ncbi:MAG: hypothetical protein II387_06620 [Oscillospiraceae bacterium]|nr:hypothetical protein [Oscillospiraceae bacterium]